METKAKSDLLSIPRKLVKVLAMAVGLLASLLCLMALVGLIEGILYLTKSDAEFYTMYQVNRKPWF